MNTHSQSDPWIGRLLDNRYRLDQRLGGGGMGDVFLVMDTRVGKKVALKLLKEALVVSEELRKRFDHEIAVCVALSSSDHIVDVRDSGVTSEGHPFYVMEYLRGESLGQLLRREKRLSVERSVSVINQVCQGLRLAHGGVTLWRDGATASEHVKVVHRDLKPDNIFLVPTTLGELVKILDFGIAKIRHDQAEYTENVTNVFLGTFHYAAPEQLGVEQDLDERADIYSLGIILYEMLAGTDPFGLGLNLRSISEMSWAMAHTSKPPQPLRVQLGCEGLSPELEAVVLRCLQKLPDERFASVEELIQALNAATVPQLPTPSPSREVGGTPVAPQPPLPLPPEASEVRGPRLSTPTPDPSEFPSIDLDPEGRVGSPTQPSPPQLSLTTDNSRFETLREHQKQPNPPRSRKSALLLAGAGVAISLPLALGSYYLLRLFSPPLTQEAEPIVKELKFSLSNTLSGHSDSVWAIAYTPSTGYANSPDGQILASGSGDKTIKLWNLATSKLLHTLSGHLNTVRSVVISPNGQVLVSASDDQTIKLWNLQTGELLRTLSGHADLVYSLALSPDGQTLASGSKDKTIKLWNLSTGKPLYTLSGHSDTVRSVTFSLDGQILASGSWDKTIKLWGLPNGKLIRTFSGHTGRVASVAFSPNGQTLASGSLDKTIKTWNPATGKLLHTLSGHSDWILSVTYAPSTGYVNSPVRGASPQVNGQTLTSGSKDKTIKIWQQ